MHFDFPATRCRRINRRCRHCGEGDSRPCAGLSEFSAASRSRGNWSMRSSASNIAATIPPASPRSKRGALTRRRAEGKLRTSRARLRSEPLAGTIGIGHTRWATHGKPTENNAHPHATDRLAVVHNGIIENFRELRDELENKGAQVLERDRHRSGRASRHRRDEAGHVAGRGGRRRRCRGCAAPSRSRSCSPARRIC